MTCIGAGNLASCWSCGWKIITNFRHKIAKMKQLNFLSLLIILLMASLSSFAQQGGAPAVEPEPEWIPDAIYEVRYWQDVTRPGSSDVLLDTMYYFGNDRASFTYSNVRCASYHCRETDSLIYSMVPKFKPHATDEWSLGENYIRKSSTVSIPFRGRTREIHKVFITNQHNKNTGIGEYALVSKEFGVIFRWNTDGEIFQLIRIDVAKEGKTVDNLEFIPMLDHIYRSDLFKPN